ncbi:MAG: glucose-6-phosphate dehydrogenase [Sphingomonadales bacterium]
MDRGCLCSDPTSLSRLAPAPASTLVIFGAGGDLTKRLLMPSLYNLTLAGLLVDGFSVIGIDHNEKNGYLYRDQQIATVRSFLAGRSGEFPSRVADEDVLRRLRGYLSYLTGDFESPDTFRRLSELVVQGRDRHGHANCVFYLATAPQFFATIIENLALAGLMREENGDFRRVVIEKPFGTDLLSARKLNAHILSHVQEHQVFRIDHFLGKETVQNILALRFANGIFEPLWRREHIDHVQITAAESVGVEHRGKFYDRTGALRDMAPNHMMQLLAMIAMEPPNSFEADAVRAEATKALQALRPVTAGGLVDDLVRGQYTAGSIRGVSVGGYRQEPNVSPDSITETYVAMKLHVENWRWAGVPFYVRMGKRLTTRRTEIAIQFKQAPHALFRSAPVECLTANFLVLHIQPSEGISLHLSAKEPGPRMNVAGVRMDFHYADWFSSEPSTGYETLLYDVMIGDATLFPRPENIDAGWSALQPILESEALSSQPLEYYPAGSEGPAAAKALLGRESRHWLSLS